MDTSPRIAIAPPGEAADHEAIKALFVEYAESLGFSLAYQGFDRSSRRFPANMRRPPARCCSPAPMAPRPALLRFGNWRRRSAR